MSSNVTTLPELARVDASRWTRLAFFVSTLIVLAISMLVVCFSSPEWIRNHGGEPTKGSTFFYLPYFALLGFGWAAPFMVIYLALLLPMHLYPRIVIACAWAFVFAFFASFSYVEAIGHDEYWLNRPVMYSNDFMFMLPMLIAGLWLPIYFSRIRSGWVFRCNHRQGYGLTPRTFSVIDLLIVVAALSGSMAILLLSHPIFLIPGLLGFLLFAWIGTMLTGATRWILGSSKQDALLIWLGFGLFLGSVTWLTLCFINLPDHYLDGNSGIIDLTCGATAFSLTLLAPILLVRIAGFQLDGKLKQAI